MIRAAVIALPLWLRLPSAPCPMLRDNALLPPFDDIAPGFWVRLIGEMDGHAEHCAGDRPYRRRSAARAAIPLSGAVPTAALKLAVLDALAQPWRPPWCCPAAPSPRTRCASVRGRAPRSMTL